MSRPLKPCGTPAAYMRHRRNGEPPCDPCREANSARLSEYRRNPVPKVGTGRNQKVAPCGTKAARQRHRRYGETCEVCDAAKQATQAQAARKSGQARRTTPEPLPKRTVRNRDMGTVPWMFGPIPEVAPVVARKAALTVAEHARDTADARLILDRLGVLDTLTTRKDAA